ISVQHDMGHAGPRRVLSGKGTVTQRCNSGAERNPRGRASPGKARPKTQVSSTTEPPQLGTCAALISQVQKAVRITALSPANHWPACLTGAGPL
ncbi:Hypothetical predicted protein, partial [Marmota monax]